MDTFQVTVTSTETDQHVVIVDPAQVKERMVELDISIDESLAHSLASVGVSSKIIFEAIDNKPTAAVRATETHDASHYVPPRAPVVGRENVAENGHDHEFVDETEASGIEGARVYVCECGVSYLEITDDEIDPYRSDLWPQQRASSES